MATRAKKKKPNGRPETAEERMVRERRARLKLELRHRKELTRLVTAVSRESERSRRALLVLAGQIAADAHMRLVDATATESV